MLHELRFLYHTSGCIKAQWRGPATVPDVRGKRSVDAKRKNVRPGHLHHSRSAMAIPSFTSHLHRQLLVRLAFVPGETLPSYVDRLSALYGTTLHAMLCRLGLVTDGDLGRLAAYGVLLSEGARKTFAFVTGLSEEDTADLLLSRYAGSVVSSMQGPTANFGELIRKACVSEWAYFKGSHFCPDCLQESGGVWLNQWKLPWSVACVRHEIMLHDVCPGCGRRPRAGRRDGLYPAFYDRVPGPTRCNNAFGVRGVRKGRGSRPCGYSFVDLEGISATPNTLRAQRTIDQALHDARAPELLANLTTTFFDDLRSICALILYASEPEDLGSSEGLLDEAFSAHVQLRRAVVDERGPAANTRTRPRLGIFTDAPTSSALMAAVVQRAMAILDQSEPLQRVESMRVLAARIYARRNRWKVLTDRRLPSGLRDVLEKSLVRLNSPLSV